MDETLNKIKEMVYQHAERANGAPIDNILNQERFLSLYVQFKILDMLDSIDSRLISLEDEVSKLNPMYK